MALKKIENELSFSKSTRMLYNIYYHPENKTPLEELRKMSLSQVLDHIEALDMRQLLTEAQHIDSEREQRLNQPKGNR